MSIISILGSVEYNVGFLPSDVLINTTDPIDKILMLGYLNGTDVIYGINWSNNIACLVTTSDKGIVILNVSITGDNISLVYPTQNTIKTLITNPDNSQSSSLELGTVYNNTFGYDVILTVYINVTEALSGSISLGVGSTNTPIQQTIVSGLTLAALNIIPVTIYIPDNYYALLNVSDTITASISGQIAMPV